MMQVIKLKRLHEGAHTPVRSYGTAIGLDFSALIVDENGASRKTMIPPHNTVSFRTGWAVEPPHGHFLMVCSRAGLVKERTLFVATAPGIIDTDYRGEILVLLYNGGLFTQYVSNGERIVQIVPLPCVDYCCAEVEVLSKTERGEAGFGSTGP
jgi:dUTP pyrophosphatase